MEESKKEVEKVEDKTAKERIQESEKEELNRLRVLRNEEKRLAREFRSKNLMAEEDQPPIMKEDEYGNITAHILMDGKYVPKPLADVMMQEKKIVLEYQVLEELKEIEEIYKKNGVKCLKINKKQDVR